MIKMAQAGYIKHLYETENKSKSEIARITGLNYRTVSKYAEKSDWNAEKLPNVEPSAYPSLGKYIPTINKWLEDDRKVPRKQRHTAKRIFIRLCEEEGYTGCYSSIKRYVKKKKYLMNQGVSAGCLPLAHPLGYGQGDFGEFIYYDDNGDQKKAYSLTISFPYSNKAYIQVFPSQNQECLLTGMRRIFEHIGGVPVRIRFDNMTTAVAQVLEGHERVLADGFMRFMLHYRFEADFCNPASGNEKGNVENKVGYGRRNALVPVPTIKSFDEFNEQLWDWCEKDAQREHYQKKVSIQSLWEEEQAELLALPEVPYDVFRYEALKVSKTGFAAIETNRYGLSPELHGKIIQAKIFCDKIEFYHDHSMIASYRRSYGKNEELMDWTQYVRTLCRKPGAAEYTRFFESMPDPWQLYLRETKGKDRRDALSLLSEMIDDGNADITADILTLSQENGRTDTDSIRQAYYALVKDRKPPEPLALLSDVPKLHYSPDLSAYDDLTGGAEND